MRWLVVAIVLVGHIAHAQAPGETPAVESDQKSLFTAYALSIGATVIPSGVAMAMDDGKGLRGDLAPIIGLSSLTFGPAVGQWYAGSELLTTGLSLRIVGIGGLIAMAIYDPDMTNPSFTVPGIIISAGVFYTGLGWDFATLPRQVRRYNKAHQLQIAPVITPNGLAVAGRF